MYQLRTYTLKDADVLEEYASVHWPRHVSTLGAVGVTVHGYWTPRENADHQLVALLSYEPGADPGQVIDDYVASPAFAADMEGFDIRANIVSVDEVLLDAAPASPLS